MPAAGHEAPPLPRFLASGGSRLQPEQARSAEPVESPPVAAELSETDAADESEPNEPASHDWLSAAARSDSPKPPVDLGAAPTLQPGDAADRPHHGEAAAKHADTSDSDRDLERLEASLHWLQRAGSSAPLPPAASLAPVPGFPRADDTRRRYSADLIAKGSRPRSLEPERMAPPPVSPRGDKLRLALYMLVPSVVVGAISYYLAASGWAPPPQSAAPAQAVTSEPMITRQASPAVVAPEHASLSTRPDGDAQVSTPEEKSPEPAATLPTEKSPEPAATLPVEKPPEPPAEKSPERQALAMPQPAVTAPPPAPAPVPDPPVRNLDPEEISILVKRGEQFIAAGDLVTARMVWQRAAEAGSAAAAIALGATYDPGVLARLGVVGMGAGNVEKARHWYQKAESLGSPEATRRLQILATR